MRRGLEQLNRNWAERGWPTLRFGIGLAYGEAFVGNIGSERKMDFTAIGAVINKASRIEQLTGETGHEILVGPVLAELARARFDLKGIGSVTVKGIPDALVVYELLGDQKEPGADAGVLAKGIGKEEGFRAENAAFSPAAPPLAADPPTRP